jgi:hypothetical protein
MSLPSPAPCAVFVRDFQDMLLKFYNLFGSKSARLNQFFSTVDKPLGRDKLGKVPYLLYLLLRIGHSRTTPLQLPSQLGAFRVLRPQLLSQPLAFDPEQLTQHKVPEGRVF